MPCASLNSPFPFGPFTVFEADGALVAAQWGGAPVGEAGLLLRRAIERLEAYFDGQLRDFALPLRPRGTPFQQRGWSRLREIPYGETCSYGSLARDLGT